MRESSKLSSFSIKSSGRKPLSSLGRIMAVATFCFAIPFPSGFPSGHAEDAETKYSIEATDEGPKVFRNGDLVAQYLIKSGNKPVIYPLIGPDGVAMTRSYPIADALPGEKQDHIHHRSFWFTHGEVNGVDFWAEGDGTGTIEQTSLEADSDGGTVTIVTNNAWKTPQGETLLTDQRQVVFHDVAGMQTIDFDITLQAGEKEVHFGDTKEGSFGIRVAGTMKVDAKLGGLITASDGKQNAEAWGTPAAWVDYTGPIASADADESAEEKKIYGIAIMNHPSSFHYPNRWHVRTYGLFAANPFGEYHFTGGKPTDGVRLAAGESLTLRYRVLLHRGDTESADIAGQWKRYSE